MQATTAQITSHPDEAPVVRPLLNLVANEWRASRGSIAAGTCVFGLVPLTWGLVYLRLEWTREPAAPFGFALLTLAGWLYALVVGANTVCRDWGRAEGHFLLARPVTPRQVILAKLLAGAGVIVAAWAAAVVCDLLSFALPLALQESPSQTPETARSFFLLPLVGLMVAYLLAFAAAVITRQTLSATLLAGLVLLIWAAAPLVWRPMFFLHPQNGSIGRAATEGLWAFMDGNGRFLGTVAMIVLVSLAASFTAPVRGRAVNVGYKQLSWTIALTILLLFVAATTEVGNSMVVLDRRMAPEPMPALDPLFASHGGQCFGMSRYGHSRTNKDAGHSMTTRSLVSFRLDDRGQISGLRTAALHFSDHPESFPDVAGTIQPVNLHWLSHVATLAVDRPDEFLITGAALGRPPHLMRVRIHWPVGGEPRITSMQVAAPASGRSHDYFLLRYATSDTHAYAIYGRRDRGTEDPARTKDAERLKDPTRWTQVFCTYAWRHEAHLDTQIEPLEASELPRLSRTNLRQRLADAAALDWYRAGLYETKGEVYVREFVLDTDLTVPVWAMETETGSRGLDWSGLLGSTPGWVEWIPRGNVGFVSDRCGVRAVGLTPTGAINLLGEYRASFLATLLRGQTHQLRLLGTDRLAEISGQTLSVYNVSKPAETRRIGFFNLSPLAGDTDIFSAGGYWVVHQSAYRTPDEFIVLAPPGGSRP